MAKKQSKSALINRIKKVMEGIEQKRVELEDLANDAMRVISDCDEALSALENAVDSLNRNL